MKTAVNHWISFAVLTSLSLFSFYIYAEIECKKKYSNFDFRSSCWGITEQEVRATEKKTGQLGNIESGFPGLIYESVTVGVFDNSRIVYGFSPLKTLNFGGYQLYFKDKKRKITYFELKDITDRLIDSYGIPDLMAGNPLDKDKPKKEYELIEKKMDEGKYFKLEWKGNEKNIMLLFMPSLKPTSKSVSDKTSPDRLFIYYSKKSRHKAPKISDEDQQLIL